jgi:hypothetical protein
MARRSPLERAMDRTAPVDTTGMDPEMKATIGGERKRRTVVKMITGHDSPAKLSNPIEAIKGVISRMRKKPTAKKSSGNFLDEMKKSSDAYDNRKKK